MKKMKKIEKTKKMEKKKLTPIRNCGGYAIGQDFELKPTTDAKVVARSLAGTLNVSTKK